MVTNNNTNTNADSKSQRANLKSGPYLCSACRFRVNYQKYKNNHFYTNNFSTNTPVAHYQMILQYQNIRPIK